VLGCNNPSKKGNMIIFGKTKSDWKALELHYRREWVCFVLGFILGSLLW